MRLKIILLYHGAYAATGQEMHSIHNSHAAFEVLQSKFNSDCEEFWLIALNTNLNPHKIILISKGTLNYCLVHPRDLFREAVRENAYALIIAHNHPSGDTTPTQQDIKLTKKLCRIAKLIEIPILDHIIFTDKNYYSFNENQLI